MKVYLAATWSHKDRIDALIPLFEGWGHEVVSTWTKEKGLATQGLEEFSDTYHAIVSLRDLKEVGICEVLVLFSNGYGSRNKGGGRFFEMGFAAAHNKIIIVVGEHEMVFGYLPGVLRVDYVEDVEWVLNELSIINRKEVA